MDTTLTVAIVLIVIGVLALLVGVALEARTRRPR
jgi:heme/copper-type cytochrome/quinol oxidase subunit 2